MPDGRDHVVFPYHISLEGMEKLVLCRDESEFLKSINETSMRWFGKESIALSPYQKSRLLPYVYHTMKTSVPQLARCLGLSKVEVRKLLQNERLQRTE